MSVEVPKKVGSKTHLEPRALHDLQALERLLAHLAELGAREAALWATGFYAGLRRGELRALRVGDVDLEAATIAVERGWDDKEGPVSPKSRAGWTWTMPAWTAP